MLSVDGREQEMASMKNILSTLAIKIRPALNKRMNYPAASGGESTLVRRYCGGPVRLWRINGLPKQGPGIPVNSGSGLFRSFSGRYWVPEYLLVLCPPFNAMI